jgi:hypothetical protein
MGTPQSRRTLPVDVALSAGLALLSGLGVGRVSGQTAVVFDPPDPAHFFEETQFAIIGNAGFVPAFDSSKLWSFSLTTGELLDPDGLTLQNYEGYVTVFPGSRLVVGPYQPAVVDASDPTQLLQIGTLWGIAGENIAEDANGVNGYMATYWGTPPGKLFSFNVQTVQVEDELALPGDPLKIARGGHRVAIVDMTHEGIMVADVSDPHNLYFVGSIAFPQSTSFSSSNNIVFAADGRTGFIASTGRVLYSFDVIDMQLLDLNGLSFGAPGPQSWGTRIAIHDNLVACVWTGGGLAFVDVSNPHDLTILGNADFGESVLIQGAATPAFTPDGTKVALPTIAPGTYVYTFNVPTGSQVAPRFPVASNPNYTVVLPTGNRVIVACTSAGYSSNVWLISGLLDYGLGDLNCDGTIDFGDINPFVQALSNPVDYASTFPTCDLLLADLNASGLVGFDDINPFVELLTGDGD